MSVSLQLRITTGSFSPVPLQTGQSLEYVVYVRRLLAITQHQLDAAENGSCADFDTASIHGVRDS